MINTIILDIGQVLARFRWHEYLIECGYDEETINKVGNATVQGNFWGEQDRGALSDEEIIKLCCNLNPDVEKEIRLLFENISELVREYDYSAEFVRRLKNNGYKVYILSNYGRRGFELSSKNFDFLNYVDGGVISYQVKYIKPEPEIYEALFEKYSIDPKEAVFLDDVQANLDGAARFGFSTILVKEFEQALEELRGFGVRV